MSTQGFIYIKGKRIPVIINEELRVAILNFGEGVLKMTPINADNQVYWNGEYYTVYDK